MEHVYFGEDGKPIPISEFDYDALEPEAVRRLEEINRLVSRDRILSPTVTFFVVQAKNGEQMLHRVAALALAGGLSRRDLEALWRRQITESRLRRARADLRIFLGEDEKKKKAEVVCATPAKLKSTIPFQQEIADDR
jgi:hypothetical protein